MVSFHTIGRNEYQRVIKDLQAQGKIATVDEFIASAPPVDVEAQEAWDRWSKLGIEYPRENYPIPPENKSAWDNYLTGTVPLPESILVAIEDDRQTMAPAVDLLRNKQLRLSVFGWIAQDCPPGKRLLSNTEKVRFSNLTPTRSLANWLQHEACTAADPREALMMIDRLHQSLNQPGTLIDAMIAVAISTIRDDSYVKLHLLGRLPPIFRDQWLAEKNGALLWVASGFDGERAFFQDSLVNWAESVSLTQSFALKSHNGNPLGYYFSFKRNSLLEGPYFWSTFSHDAALFTITLSQVSARLRHERTGPFPDYHQIINKSWGQGISLLPNYFDAPIAALENDANHRIARIAVRILEQVPTSGLPNDEADLLNAMGDPKLLSPSGDHLHLRYERLAPDRFRLVISPTSPTPDFDNPTRLKRRAKNFGAPPAKDSYVKDHHSLEIQLPKRLQRAQVTP
jgi:hypothetical protein